MMVQLPRTGHSRAGDPSRAVYLIEDGEIAITVPNRIEVGRLYPGALFGEAGVLEPRPYSAVQPPSTTRLCPVTNAEASLARKITAPAISRGVPNRPSGVRSKERAPCTS